MMIFNPAVDPSPMASSRFFSCDDRDRSSWGACPLYCRDGYRSQLRSRSYDVKLHTQHCRSALLELVQMVVLPVFLLFIAARFWLSIARTAPLSSRSSMLIAQMDRPASAPASPLWSGAAWAFSALPIPSWLCFGQHSWTPLLLFAAASTWRFIFVLSGLLRLCPFWLSDSIAACSSTSRGSPFGLLQLSPVEVCCFYRWIFSNSFLFFLNFYFDIYFCHT